MKGPKLAGLKDIGFGGKSSAMMSPVTSSVPGLRKAPSSKLENVRGAGKKRNVAKYTK